MPTAFRKLAATSSIPPARISKILVAAHTSAIPTTSLTIESTEATVTVPDYGGPKKKPRQSPEGWGPQGGLSTGCGGPARVPNLRVCYHLRLRVARAGGKGDHTSCRGTVLLAWSKPPSGTLRRKSQGA